MTIEIIRFELNDGQWSRWMTFEVYERDYKGIQCRAIEIDTWSEKEWQSYCNAQSN